MDAQIEVIRHLEDRGKPEPITVGGENYVTRKIELPPAEPIADALVVGSLSAYADYVRAQPEGELAKHFTHVRQGGRGVALIRPLEGRHRQREKPIAAKAPEWNVEKFVGKLGTESARYHGLEIFNIAVLTLFAETDERAALLKLTSTITSSQVRKDEDDGMAQQVTVKQGVAGLPEHVTAPNRWTLRPFCTFPEIEQPERTFLLRFKGFQQEDGAPQAALIEIATDWEHRAAEAVAAKLRELIDNADHLIVF